MTGYHVSPSLMTAASLRLHHIATVELGIYDSRLTGAADAAQSGDGVEVGSAMAVGCEAFGDQMGRVFFMLSRSIYDLHVNVNDAKINYVAVDQDVADAAKGD